MSDTDSTAATGYLGLRVAADSPAARRIVAALRAYWRAEPNGGRMIGGGPVPLWGVCPCCRGEALGVGSWPDGTLRVTCWDCDADERDVAERLQVGAPANLTPPAAQANTRQKAPAFEPDRLAEGPLRRVGAIAQRLRGPRL